MKRAQEIAGPVPVAALQNLAAYAPPRHPAPVDLVLSGNEGDKPPASLLESLVGRETGVLRQYPNKKVLERHLAQLLSIEPGQIIVTAGGDEAIDRLCRAYLAPGRRLVLPEPTFLMFTHYAKLAGAEIDEVAWPEGPFPVDEVLRVVTEQTAMITVVSPNNPTGAVATADDLRRLSEEAPHTVLLVDLAYEEYADDDLTGFALSLPNAVVVRTISKAWGLAGLRIGYAAGPTEMVDVLRAAGGPYPVSGLSVALVEEALQTQREAKERHVAAVRRERAGLEAVGRELGLHVPSSQGNFVLMRTVDATWLRDGLAGLGIAVRIFPEDPRLAGCARVSCPGDGASLERVAHAMRAVLRPDALLFDLDGVLADVSGSYRRAIAETAATFDVEVSSDDIAAAKAEGNANNDWQLTHRLIERAGGNATLDEVTRRFEALYQGTPEEPGLYRHETLLPDRELLARLARRMPLAIVTGRPRSDAERWLRDQELMGVFATVVCMEDAPLKPDPGPVTAALGQLGVSHAWLFGDTPDDIRAARAAGVVPVGVPAPGETVEHAVDTLLPAGGARVIESLAEIEDMLP